MNPFSRLSRNMTESPLIFRPNSLHSLLKNYLELLKINDENQYSFQV